MKNQEYNQKIQDLKNAIKKKVNYQRELKRHRKTEKFEGERFWEKEMQSQMDNWYPYVIEATLFRQKCSDWTFKHLIIFFIQFMKIYQDDTMKTPFIFKR